jgi:hypothetical protein
MCKLAIKSIFALFLLFLVLLDSSMVAHAESAGADAEKSMMQLYDWILFIDVDNLGNYLRYDQSRLTPLTRMKVTYQETVARYTLRGVTADVPAPIKDEEFWYHLGQPVGLRRFNRIPVRSEMQGAFYFRSPKVNGIFDNTASVANCITRLLLEVDLEHSILAAVIVPDDSLEKVSSELGRFNFFPVTKDSKSANLTIRLVSYPLGDEHDFYYAPN